MNIDYRVLGDVMQALEITLRHGEEVFAEAGSTLYMSSGVELQAEMQGGVMKGLMRKFLAGESMFMSVFRSNVPQGRWPWPTRSRGRSSRWSCAARRSWRSGTRSSAASATSTSPLFGGEGLFYASLTGPGHVVLQTLPFSRFANRITAAAGGSRGESRGFGGLGGNILGGIISD